MKKIILLSLLVIAVSVNAGPRIYMACSYDPNSLGLQANARASMYSGGYPPSYSNLAVRELYTNTNRIAITASNGFARTGSLTMVATVSNGDTIAKSFTQNYTVSGKTMILNINNNCLGIDGSMFLVRARITFPNGAPAVINGITTSTGVGITMRFYPQFNVVSGSYNRVALDAAGWRPLTAYSDVVGSNGMSVSAKLAGMWGNSPFRLLGRFYDSYWRSRTTPIWNIQWVDGPAANGAIALTSNLRGFYYYDSPIWSWDPCSPSIQTISTGGNSVASELSPFVPDAGGSNIGAFLTQMDPAPSLTGNSLTEIYLHNAASQGSRSIKVYWIYSDAAYSNPDYSAYGSSVRAALNGLLWGNNSTVSITTEQSPWLKCNYYGDSDNLCTIQELFALERAQNTAMFDSKFSINTAVYVLENSQGYFDGPEDTYGITISSSVPDQSGGNDKVRTSKAFVFPYSVNFHYWGGNTRLVYLNIAHELGHTFGMSHQFSNCTFEQGWDCANGTIMSYASESNSPQMDYGADAKTWFNKAPDNWVQPVCGSGPINNSRVVGGVYNYSLKVKDLINW